MDEVKTVISSIEKQKNSTDEGESKKFENLHNVIKQMDLSVLKSETKATVLGSKKRKNKHSLQKSGNRAILLKELEDVAKQINLAKEVLTQIYEIQDERFTKMISKRNDNTRGVLTSRALLDCIIQRGKTIPLWLGRPEETAPPLCGCIEPDINFVSQVGDLVAASVGQKNKKNWILTEVVSYNHDTGKYVVDDIFESSKAEHTVRKEDIIPLPRMRANPETSPEALFPKKSKVLALYPQTTCFYRGQVYDKPNSPTDQYQILFEDSRYKCNFSPPTPVDQCYVLRDRRPSELAHSRDKPRRASTRDRAEISGNDATAI